MSHAIQGKTMKNERNIIDIKLVNNEKDYLKCTSKRIYLSRKIFGNNLVAIRKNRLTSKPNKPAYIGMCVLEIKESINV